MGLFNTRNGLFRHRVEQPFISEKLKLPQNGILYLYFVSIYSTLPFTTFGLCSGRGFKLNERKLLKVGVRRDLNSGLTDLLLCTDIM